MKRSFITIGASVLSVFFVAEANAISISPTDDANTLIGSILDPGITVSGGVNYIGVKNQSGVFEGGTSSGLSFNRGIVLSTGDVNQIAGPNDNGTESIGIGNTSDDDINTVLGTSGDSDLDSIVTPSSTQDAAVLEFDFQFGDGSIGGDLFFNFVFASEEYIDFIGSSFNDVFGFFVDGVNIALVPGSGDIISVNSINNSTNSSYYVNNVDNADGLSVAGLDLGFDGLTTTMTANLNGLSAGLHTMKFAIADNTDGRLDSAVFIQAGSFASYEKPKGEVPLPGTLALMSIGMLGLVRRNRR